MNNVNGRKVKDLAHIFKDGNVGAASNSTTNGHEYHLFGHHIARIQSGDLIGNWCGYPTATTQRHLSNIAVAFNCNLDSFGGLSRERGRELGESDFLMKEKAR